MAIVGLLYKIYSGVSTHYGLPVIPSEDVQLFADVVAYGLIGTGIYSRFEEKGDKNEVQETR